MTATSDMYEGMYIPKGELNEIVKETTSHNSVTGAIVLTNIWYASRLLADVFGLN
jgi:nitrogen fixation protein